ncbi:MAG TPA: hypothetical protein DD716_00505, partial [Thiomicrospira sp.]|nr:hypothetical protein [Thiomicrospira sp.]
KAKLDTYVEYLNANPDAKIEVSGHTDSRGSASFNQNLSEQRADAVKNYLESKDIDSSRILTTGFGESNPVGDNMTAAGRAENRRVELMLIK